MQTLRFSILAALALVTGCATTGNLNSATNRRVSSVFQAHQQQLAVGQTFAAGITLNGFFDTLRTACALGEAECTDACGRRAEMRTLMTVWNRTAEREELDANLTWDTDIDPLCRAHGMP